MYFENEQISFFIELPIFCGQVMYLTVASPVFTLRVGAPRHAEYPTDAKSRAFLLSGAASFTAF